MVNQGLFHVKQTVNGSTMVGFGNTRAISQQLLDTNYGIEFRAADIPQFGNWGSLFDQYRINKIVLKLIPMANVNQTGSVTTVNPGVVASVIDYDNGGTTLVALDQYEQYASCRISPVIKMSPITRILVPRVNIGVQNQGGAVVSGVNKGKQWIDCGLSTVAHHGVKIFVDKYATAGSAQTWQVFATYYLSFRNVH